MEILFLCPMWGMKSMPIESMLVQIKNAGYDGIEFNFPVNSPAGQKEMFIEKVKQLDLVMVAQQCYAEGQDFETYCNSFKEHLEYLASFRPLFINSHTGKDYYSAKQMERLILIAEEFESDSHVRILHETHRGKYLFCITKTLECIQKHRNLSLTADFSHFCTVSESYLQDQLALLAPIIQRSRHIHARVGSPQSAQITDPRLPEWQDAVEYHLKWWDDIVENNRNRAGRYSP